MKSNYKSPFFIIEDFISPLFCEDIINRLNNVYPDADKDNKFLKTIRYNNLSEFRILPYLERIVPQLEEYYNFVSKGILRLSFEWLVEDYVVESPRCLNYKMVNNKWARINDIGITGIVFLNDFNDKSDFDSDFEVYGGKLEFINHNLNITPKRGTVVFFPEGPNFLNTNSSINAGELNQIRIHIASEENYNYDMNKFPGNYKTWFNK